MSERRFGPDTEAEDALRYLPPFENHTAQNFTAEWGTVNNVVFRLDPQRKASKSPKNDP